MTRPALARTRVRPASPATRLLAWVLAAASVAFAVVNVGFELTGRFDQGPLAEYAAGISIVNWSVVLLKLIGAAVALLTVAPQSRIPARVVNIAIWGAAGTLGVYALGSVVQAAGMAAGVSGPPSEIDTAGLAYVLAFLLAAAGFAALAASHSRRSELGGGPAITGVLGGAVILGTILLALPVVLTGLGIMPSG